MTTGTCDAETAIARLKQAGENQAREIDALKQRAEKAERDIKEWLDARCLDAGEDSDDWLEAQEAMIGDQGLLHRNHAWVVRHQLRALADNAEATPASAWTSERPTGPGLFWLRFNAGAHVLVRVSWGFDGDDLYVGWVDAEAKRNEAGCMLGDIPSLNTVEWQRAEPRP